MDDEISPEIDQERESWKEKRTKVLGYRLVQFEEQSGFLFYLFFYTYRPQNELFHNFFLPYQDRLDKESSQLLDYIKQELGRALALREMNPGTGIFVSKLMRCEDDFAQIDLHSLTRLYELPF